jgi:hypothetical protein
VKKQAPDAGWDPLVHYQEKGPVRDPGPADFLRTGQLHFAVMGASVFGREKKSVPVTISHNTEQNKELMLNSLRM